MAIAPLKDGRPPKLKLPKTLGACADLAYDLKEGRLAMAKILAEWEEQEKAVKQHIIDNLSKSKDGGAIGQRYKAVIVRDTIPRIIDDKKFYDYVKKHGAFDLLQRRLNDKAVRDRVEHNKGKPLPGLEDFGIVKVSITKK